MCDNVTYFSDFPEDQKEWSSANGVQGTNCGLRVFLERGLTYPYRSRRGGGAFSVSSSGKCDLLKSLLREVTLFFYCFLKDALDIF